MPRYTPEELRHLAQRRARVRADVDQALDAIDRTRCEIADILPADGGSFYRGVYYPRDAFLRQLDVDACELRAAWAQAEDTFRQLAREYPALSEVLPS